MAHHSRADGRRRRLLEVLGSIWFRQLRWERGFPSAGRHSDAVWHFRDPADQYLGRRTLFIA